MTSLASPGSMVVVPRRSRLPCVDLLISRWRLWPQLRTILPVAVRPKRFFAPLFVLSLGIFISVRGVRRRGTHSQRHPPPIRAALYSDAACRAQASTPLLTPSRGAADRNLRLGWRLGEPAAHNRPKDGVLQRHRGYLRPDRAD